MDTKQLMEEIDAYLDENWEAMVGDIASLVEVESVARPLLRAEGAPFGPGTVLIMVLQAAIFQMVCRILRFEPRDITHEVFRETFRNITGR